MSEVGSGQVAIFPTFRGFRSSVNSEVAGAGREGGKTFSSAFSAGAGDPGQALVKKLNAQIASGAKALSAARLSEQDATGKVRVAEAALNEARSRGEQGSARVIAAEERLATAKRKLTEASGKTIAASDQLRQSQSKLAEAMDSAGASGEQASGRFARGWQSVKSKLNGAAKGAVDDEGAKAQAAADKAGQDAGGRFGRGFKALVGPAIALASAGIFGSFVGEAARASDATDKFKATMDFAGLDTSAIDAASKAAKDYADQTVFDLPTIQNTIAQLASNGVQDYTGLTKAAGNLNAVAGGNADTFKSVAMVMTQTAGAGKLTTENWNQMADAIPGAAGPLMRSLEQAGAYTGNFRDAMAAGQITSDEFNAALMKLGNDPVAVEAAKSTKTFEGAIGNLQATINSGLMGALDKMKPGITGAINLLSGGLGKAFEWTGKAASGLIDVFANGDFTTNLREAFNVEEDSGFVSFLFSARDAAQEVAGGFRAFGAAFRAADGDVTSAGFPGFMEQLANAVRPVFDAFSALAPTVLGLFQSFSPIGLLFQALQPVLPVLAAAIGQLGMALAGVLGSALTTVQPLIQTLIGHLSGVFIAILPSIVGLIAMLGDAFTMLSPVISMVLAAVIPLVTTLVSQLSPIIISLVTSVMPPLISIFSMVIAAIAPLITQILGVLIPVIQALMPVVVTVFGVIAEIITAAMQIVQGIIQVVTGIISGNWSQVWSGIQNIFGGIWNAIVAVVRGAIQIVGSVIQAGLSIVGNVVGSVLGGIGSFFADTWRNITNGVSGFISGFLGFFNDLPGKIMGALSGASTWLLDVGKNIVQGLINGAKGMIDSAVNAIKDVGGAMLDGVKGFLGIKSPSRRFRFEVGQQVGEGARLGILDKVKSVAEAAKQLVTVPSVGGARVSGGAGGPQGSPGGQTNYVTINQVDDPIGTSHAVVRRLGAIAP
ncbi:tape measure protein [Paenarthrobacter sp. YAF11_1]|uniref:tape measure protein n=1 Tax=Paenarthrobacter sp. YAF11_1 TaxID=3233074 RepID=UPI003F99584B